MKKLLFRLIILLVTVPVYLHGEFHTFQNYTPFRLKITAHLDRDTKEFTMEPRKLLRKPTVVTLRFRPQCTKTLLVEPTAVEGSNPAPDAKSLNVNYCGDRITKIQWDNNTQGIFIQNLQAQTSGGIDLLR